MLALGQSLPESPIRIITLFDLREEEAIQSLHHLRSALSGDAEIEVLEKHRALLIIRPGGALRLTV